MFNSILDTIIDLLIVHFELDDGAREIYCEFRKENTWYLSRCVSDGITIGGDLAAYEIDPNGFDPARVSDPLTGYTEEGERYLSITYSL